MTTNDQRPRPAHYTEEKSTAHGVVFFTEKPKPAGIAYKGKSTKRSWHWSFSSIEARDAYIAAWFAKLETTASERRARTTNRQSLDATQHFAVGDIIDYTWGYEQTNAYFYQVLAVTARTVMVRRLETIRTESGPMAMSGTAMPNLGIFVPNSEPERHLVQPGYDARPIVRFEFGIGHKWDGKPVSCSWYA